jgi:hypothetical protein
MLLSKSSTEPPAALQTDVALPRAGSLLPERLSRSDRDQVKDTAKKVFLLESAKIRSRPHEKHQSINREYHLSASPFWRSVRAQGGVEQTKGRTLKVNG